jgi:hypothetical protein
VTALVILEAFVIVVLTILVAGLLRSHAEILRALHDLGAGLGNDATRGSGGATSPIQLRTRPGVPEPRGVATPAFDLTGVDVNGDAAVVAVSGVAHPTLLAFLTSGCNTCASFWEAFSNPNLEVPGGARVVVVTKGAEDESLSRLRPMVPPGLTTVMTSDAWTEYQVPGSPYFIYIDGERGQVVGEGAAGSWEQVATFLRQSLEDAGYDGSDRRALRPSAAAAESGRDRADRIDAELRAAGIEPGDPRLFASPPETPAEQA